jgi:hypothetical protein
LSTLKKIADFFTNPESIPNLSFNIQKLADELSKILTSSSNFQIKFDFAQNNTFDEKKINFLSLYIEDFYLTNQINYNDIDFSLLGMEEFVDIVKKRFVLLEGDFPPPSEAEIKEKEELLFALNF